MSFQENIAILGFPEICRRAAILPKLSQIGGKTLCTQKKHQITGSPNFGKIFRKLNNIKPFSSCNSSGMVHFDSLVSVL